MKAHVFQKLPTFCDSMVPALLRVRCPGWHGHKCGRPHLEYFGPKNLDTKASTLRFWRHALGLAFRMSPSQPHHRPLD